MSKKDGAYWWNLSCYMTNSCTGSCHHSHCKGILRIPQSLLRTRKCMWDALVGEELLFQNQYRDIVDHTHLLQPHTFLYDAKSKEQKNLEIWWYNLLKLCWVCNNYSRLAVVFKFGSGRDKCLVEFTSGGTGDKSLLIMSVPTILVQFALTTVWTEKEPILLPRALYCTGVVSNKLICKYFPPEIFDTSNLRILKISHYAVSFLWSYEALQGTQKWEIYPHTFCVCVFFFCFFLPLPSLIAGVQNNFYHMPIILSYLVDSCRVIQIYTSIVLNDGYFWILTVKG